MKAMKNVLVAGLLGLVALSGSAQACGNRCPAYQNFQPVPNAQPFPQLNTEPQPISNPPTPGNGLSQNDTVVNDLPADAKLAIRNAAAKARARTVTRQATNNRVNVRSAR